MKNKSIASPLLDRMMSKGDHNAPPQPLDPRRAELASAITKTFINQSMGDIKAVLGQIQQAKGEAK